MARDAKLTIKWDNSVTGTKALPNATQTIGGAANATVSSTSLWVNFGGFLQTVADAASFAAQADAPAPGSSAVPLLHSGSRDQLYMRVAYQVNTAYANAGELKFTVEATQDVTAATPVTYIIGQTVAPNGVTGGAPISGSASTATVTAVSGTVLTAAAHGLSVGDYVQLTTVGGLVINSQTPPANSVYQVLTVPTSGTFTIGLGPGSLYSGASTYATTPLPVSGTISGCVFKRASGGRIASIPLSPNFAGSLRLNTVGVSGAGSLIITSASVAYGRDSAAIG